MPRVVWLDSAKQDLRLITNYIKERNRDAAISYATGVREACRGLRDFPEQGRRFNTDYRLIVYRNHVIFYRHRDGTVEIVSVIDARRDIQAIID